MVRLEMVDSLNFQCRFSDLKTRNFPKHTNAARSRPFSVSGREPPRSVGGIPSHFGRSPSSPSRR